jgi:hypothetical protein
MSNWNRETTLQLIEKIRASNVWDVKSREYKDCSKRKDIFSTIGEELGFSPREVESKWHTLKSQYSRELVKVMSSRKSGAGTEDIYTPSWYAYKSLSFLSDTHRPHLNINTDEVEIEVSKLLHLYTEVTCAKAYLLNCQGTIPSTLKK